RPEVPEDRGQRLPGPGDRRPARTASLGREDQLRLCRRQGRAPRFRRAYRWRVAGRDVSGRLPPGRPLGGREGKAQVAGLAWSVLWVPSQNGWLRVRLQPHSQTFSTLVTVNFTGVNSVVLCVPSQKGWLLEPPQRHHQYSPGASSTAYGDFCAMGASAITVSPRGTGGAAFHVDV